MQTSHSDQSAVSTHRRVKSSTTLNRKYVKKPQTNRTEITVTTKGAPSIKHFNTQRVADMNQGKNIDQPIQAASMHPLQATANTKLKVRCGQAMPQSVKKPSATELKNRAIAKALSEASQTTTQSEQNKKPKLHFGFPRIMLALSCAAAAVLAIVYFVNLNMPDISLKVAAMQTGFDASYPSYVPRDFNLSSITSEEGRVVLNFENQSEGIAFSLTEKKSAWDSDALLSNYIKEAYGDNYSVIKEQGLTIYVDGSNASWVNGGVFFSIKTTSGSLTKKQIKSIAVSL